MYRLASSFLGLLLAKLAPFVPFMKLIIGAGVILAFATAEGLPIHDIWFDVVLIQFSSGVVGGMPEPDFQMSMPRFFYTWFYRSSHLWVSAATAYLIHPSKWAAIRETTEESDVMAVIKGDGVR